MALSSILNAVKRQPTQSMKAPWKVATKMDSSLSSRVSRHNIMRATCQRPKTARSSRISAAADRRGERAGEPKRHSGAAKRRKPFGRSESVPKRDGSDWGRSRGSGPHACLDDDVCPASLASADYGGASQGGPTTMTAAGSVPG